ncbi:MAG: hypothetical protein QOD75_3543 [Blastocatellia bacterium]|nr:hypothetical protein [Blastocatellia bacterium]
MVDYLKYFDRENYLFEEVHVRFHSEHSLGAFDFFSIVIWKANRAKSKIARRLLNKDRIGKRNLEARCRALTKALYKAPDPKERLRLLIKDWGFVLPMASAILAVCWPDEFPVYDYRIRDQIKGFSKLSTANFEKLWKGYQEYKANVSRLVPGESSLRDKDRFLYGKSNAVQLKEDIRQSFNVLES